ncbi:MAG: hypothetical protein FWD13_01765 [Treponema sp.]|nr:hypothetical protein [Treponema sp.]
MIKKYLFIFFLLVISCLFAFSQTFISVPLGHPVYTVFEQAQMRGLCGNLSGARPYSRAKALLIIDEILGNADERRFGGLSEAERRILEQLRNELNPGREGFNFLRGTISTEHIWDDVYFSGEFGFGMDLSFAGGFYPLAGGYQYNELTDNNQFTGALHPASGDFYGDFTIMPNIYFMGDLGRNTSYGVTINGLVIKSPRAKLGMYNYYIDNDPDDINKLHTTYSEPLAHFPYSYKKRWDGFVWALGNVNNSGQLAWPESVSIGYSMYPELAGNIFNGHVTYRFARLDREWAGMTTNSSLVLNQSAQPFLAFETVISPFNWITISSLTGVLEYHNATGSNNSALIKESSETFQNAFSIVMLEFDIKNYFHIGFGSSVIWPKRFELGYLFPFMDNFLYQNNVGDFDNLALFLNLKGQYPGLGKIWFSLFMDEANPEPQFFELDRMMYAYQFGASFFIPWLPFSSVTVSYTKNEPYNYTHPKEEVPWYIYEMEQNFVNFGKALGHYIPPNSDELLIRFETIPFPRSMFSFQYQMIRHGANYGDRAVDGSTLWSELPHEGRSEKDALRKFFLRDGAYQWIHILRLKGEYSLTAFNVPLKIFCEIGGVYSYFTDINSSINPNSGSPNPYSIINTPQYPHSLRFIGTIGIQIFPKF